MYSDRCKYFIIGAIVFLVASCNNSDKNAQAASELLSRAQQSISAEKYEYALQQLDSIDSIYPSMIDVRRKGMALRPKAIEAITIKKIQVADSLIADAQTEILNLESLFRHVDGDGLDGYYIPKSSYNHQFTNSTGIQPRVNDTDFRFYVVVNNSGKPIGVNQIGFNVGSKEVLSEAIPMDNDRCLRLEGSELASFLPEEVDSLGYHVFNRLDDVKGAFIVGKSSRLPIKLSKQDFQDFATSWRFANRKQQLRSALILREKLDRQLQITRDQIANTAIDE